MPPEPFWGREKSLASARIETLYRLFCCHSCDYTDCAVSAYNLHRNKGVALGIGTALKFVLVMKHVFYAAPPFVA